LLLLIEFVLQAFQFCNNKTHISQKIFHEKAQNIKIDQYLIDLERKIDKLVYYSSKLATVDTIVLMQEQSLSKGNCSASASTSNTYANRSCSLEKEKRKKSNIVYLFF